MLYRKYGDFRENKKGPQSNNNGKIRVDKKQIDKDLKPKLDTKKINSNKIKR